MASIHEPAREIPVIDEVDICVLGGSCTGVFAAVRAARLGARVALVERQNGFGGMASAALVSVWHTLLDTAFQRQIIGGLTQEVLDRLAANEAVAAYEQNPHIGFVFRPAELTIELDALVREAGISPHLHTLFCTALTDGSKVTAAIVENKSGRGAIIARQFIDATGDGDLCARVGLPVRVPAHLQPPTTCAWFHGFNTVPFNLAELRRLHGVEFDLPDGFAWGTEIPGLPEMYMYAGTRVPGANCADAAEFTRAEMEGRRQVRAIQQLIRRYAPAGVQVVLANLGATIGIRETRHVDCHYQLSADDVLYGRRFPDAIANGSYRVDVHYDDQPGVWMRYLDGTEEIHRIGQASRRGRWRAASADAPTFYQIPYRCLLPRGEPDNVLVCGRAIDADREAFGAIRVMVNTNQTGEAAGAAAWLAWRDGTPVSQLDPTSLRATLAAQGAIIIDP